MRKTVYVCAVMAAVTVFLAGTAFAGEWKRDSVGWWYQNDDGSYQQNQWFQDKNGKYYYFNAAGYMLAGTVTPDGYQVGADGAWISGAAAAGNTAGIDLGSYIGTAAGNFAGSHSSFRSGGGTVYSDGENSVEAGSNGLIVRVTAGDSSCSIVGIRPGDSVDDARTALASQGWTDKGRVSHMQLYWMQRGDGLIIRFWVSGSTISSIEAGTGF